MHIELNDALDLDYAVCRCKYPDDPSPPYTYDHEDKRILVDGEDVGFISWLESGDQAIITQLYISPPHRRKGLAEVAIGILQKETEGLVRVIATQNTMCYYTARGFEHYLGMPILVKSDR